MDNLHVAMDDRPPQVVSGTRKDAHNGRVLENTNILVNPAGQRCLGWPYDVPYDVLLLRLADSVPALKQAFPDALSRRSEDRPTRSLGGGPGLL